MKPDDPAVRDLLRRAMVVRIATLSRNGRPSVNPIYFIDYRRMIWIGTSDWTLAVRNVKADPRVSLLFNDERVNGRCLRVSGHASVRTDREVIHAYSLRVAIKYVLPPGALFNRLVHLRQAPLLRYYHAQSAARGKTCIIEVTPEVVEWID